MNLQAPHKKVLHLAIYGRVQGVSFRESMRRKAQNLGVSGWVRNRSDGSVEAVVSGESAAVESIVRWAQRGPVQAQVETVEVEPCGGSYTNFEIIY